MESQGLSSSPNHLTPAECLALNPLRVWYQHNHGLFTAQELSRLRFLHWLAEQRQWGGIQDGAEYETPAERIAWAA